MAWPSNSSLDEEVDALFEGAVVVPLNDAWRALGIKKSYGFDLVNRGVLERVKIEGASKITVRSIKNLLKNGMPPRTPAKVAEVSSAANDTDAPMARPKLARPT